MTEKMSGGPSVQSIPKGSEWEERCRRFFATDPGWATVSSEYPPGSPYSWVRTPESPTPMPCGEIPHPDVPSVSALGERDRGELEWIYLVAGMAVLRGMVVAQSGLGYDSAKSLVLDLIDAQSFLSRLQAIPPSPGMVIPRERTVQIEVVRGRLHALFDEVVARLALSDRRATRLARTRATAEAMVSEFVDAHDNRALGHIDELVASLRSDLIEALVESPDWQHRAMVAEDRLEAAEYLLAGLDRAVRELAGPEARSLVDVHHRMESLEGERLAADQRRDEMAAHLLQMRDFIGRLRSNELPEDLEMIHHSIMASPRSAETERVAQACIDDRVRAAYGGMVTAHAARETELLADVRALKGVCEGLKSTREELEKSVKWWREHSDSRQVTIDNLRRERNFFKKSALVSGVSLIVATILLAAVASGLLHSA